MNLYAPPLGLPLRWQDEMSGQLRGAVEAYLNNRIEQAPVTVEQITLIRNYLTYYINAPCWEKACLDEEHVSNLASLRNEITTADTSDAIWQWIQKCLEIGMDPL